jgi:hypothetical protein
MIYEMRKYQLKVGCIPQYLKQFEEIGYPIIRKYCTLVGYWVVESGRLNQVIHVWAFADAEQRRIAREQWMQDPAWAGSYLPLALPLVESQESILMTAAPFSPIR